VPNALQCPACGAKHRLSSLSGEPIFTCSECGRLLKTPAEFRRPEPDRGEAPRPSASARVQRGGAATRDRTSVQPAPGPTPSSGRRPVATPPKRRRRPAPTTDLALPLRILAWVIAVGLGAWLVRWFARVTGWLTGDSVIDLITGSGIMRYVRVFTVVPVWALVSAGLATLFIEGGRWLARRRAIATSAAPRAARPDRPAPRPATRPPAAAPRRPAPKVAPKPAAPPPVRQPAPPVAEAPAPTGTAGAPRPRRIPRRDVSS
jgi:hypothetical protein